MRKALAYAFLCSGQQPISNLLPQITPCFRKYCSTSQISAGQATNRTHPQFLGPNELFPGVSASELHQRRQKVLDQLPPGAVALLVSSQQLYRAGVVPYVYRQDGDYLYLTGLNQPSVAILQKQNHEQGIYEDQFMLFVPETSAEQAIWTGQTCSVASAVQDFAAHKAMPLHQLPSMLSSFLNTTGTSLYSSTHYISTLNQLATTYSIPRLPPINSHKPLQPHIHSNRWIKSSAESSLLAKSAGAASQGVRAAMANTRPGINERDINALFGMITQLHGAPELAFPPVIAGAERACTIHYGANNQLLHAGELLLMDAGCEYAGYVSDVARTWPVSGKFSDAQRRVYDVVLATHYACLEACVQGNTLRNIHQLCCSMLREGLVQLGILGGVNRVQDNMLFRQMFPHAVGHWLGLDVHDCSTVSSGEPLKAGVCLTIEPALYIPNDDRYSYYKGIGIRIEDMVMMDESGKGRVISDLPFSVEEVEQEVQNGPLGGMLTSVHDKLRL